MSPDVSLAVNALLRADADLTALVGTSIYFDRLPQTASGNALALWVITETAHMNLARAQGLDQASVQVDAYGLSRSDANAIASAAWKALDGFQGVSAEVHVLGVSRNTGIRYTTDRVQLGTDQYRFIASQELLISYDSINLITP